MGEQDGSDGQSAPVQLPGATELPGGNKPTGMSLKKVAGYTVGTAACLTGAFFIGGVLAKHVLQDLSREVPQWLSNMSGLVGRFQGVDLIMGVGILLLIG